MKLANGLPALSRRPSSGAIIVMAWLDAHGDDDTLFTTPQVIDGSGYSARGLNGYVCREQAVSTYTMLAKSNTLVRNGYRLWGKPEAIRKAIKEGI